MLDDDIERFSWALWVPLELQNETPLAVSGHHGHQPIYFGLALHAVVAITHGTYPTSEYLDAIEQHASPPLLGPLHA